MRYPVGKGTLEDFTKYWYSADSWDTWRGTYYHGGEDINLKTGGNTDLGQPIYSIADGEVTSVHTHTTGFGKHLHIKHQGAWGVVYSHYAHCDSFSVKVGDKVTEGQQIATLGNSGTKHAHLHFETKLQPTGIDSVAKTKQDLSKWTDPFAFINKWSKEENMSSTLLQECESKLAWYKVEYPREQQRLVDRTDEFNNLKKEFENYRLETQKTISDLKTALKGAETEATLQRDALKDLLGSLAETLNTTQEAPRIKAKVVELIEIEDLLNKERRLSEDKDEVISGQNASLIDLRLKVEQLEQDLKQAKGLNSANYSDLFEAIITKFINQIKRKI